MIGRRSPTQRSPWRFSQRATGLPWNLTFADAAEHVRDSESGHSQVAIIDLGKVPAERLHPKAAYSRCRPKPAGQVAPKLPDGNTSPFLLRFYEAAFRDLTQPAITGPW